MVFKIPWSSYHFGQSGNRNYPCSLTIIEPQMLLGAIVGDRIPFFY